WDPAKPGTGPVELGGYEGTVRAVAVLPDGRVVTGGVGVGVGVRELGWDPTGPGTRPVAHARGGAAARVAAGLPGGRVVGRHDAGVAAVAVLPDGRVVTGGDDDQVRLWDVRSNSPGSLLACSAYALATSPS